MGNNLENAAGDVGNAVGDVGDAVDDLLGGNNANHNNTANNSTNSSNTNNSKTVNPTSFQRMLDNARVHDQDGILTDGENSRW